MTIAERSSRGGRSIGKQFGRFALVGAVGTLAHYAVLYGLVESLGWGAVAASGCGALTGMVVNYLLNYALTFNSVQPHRAAFPKFAMIAGVGLGLNQALMALLVNRLGVYYLIAQVGVTGVVLFWNFLGNRFWTFQADHVFQQSTRLESSAASGNSRLPWLQLGPAVLGLVLAIRFLTLGTYPLFDPSESRYAEMARKMVETGIWVTPQIDYGVPFWGKPPLAVWLNALAIELFGVSEFSVRLSALLLSMAVVWNAHRLARSQGGEKAAYATSAFLATMAGFFVLSGSVGMDQCLTLGVTLAMAAFWRAVNTSNVMQGYLFFVGLSIGLLAKGPVAVVLVGLPVVAWILVRKQWTEAWRRLPWFSGALLMLAISAPWYVLAEQRTPGFLEYFFVGEHWKRFTEPGWHGDLYGAGRARPRGTIWLFWFLTALPWSPMIVSKFLKAIRRGEVKKLLDSADGWRLYCLLWMSSPLLFFTLSANIIWTYALPGLPGLALLLGDWRREQDRERNPLPPGEGRVRAEIHDPSTSSWQGSQALALAPTGFVPLASLSPEGERLGSTASRRLTGEAMMAFVGMLAPALFVVAVLSWRFHPLEFFPTQKTLVADYYRLRAGVDEPLLYFRGQPYSALFYTEGASRKLREMEEIQAVMDKPGKGFIACLRKDCDFLPDAIKNRLSRVSTYGEFQLFRRMDRGTP